MHTVKLSKQRWDKYTPISGQQFPLGSKKEEEWNRLVGIERIDRPKKAACYKKRVKVCLFL